MNTSGQISLNNGTSGESVSIELGLGYTNNTGFDSFSGSLT